MATRKKFIDIDLPLLDETISVLGTPETLAGKTIKMDLSRKLRGKSLEVIFKVYNKDNKLYGLPKNLNLMKFYIQRMMRKRISYIEDSFAAKCQDAEVTIKPFLITRKRVSRAVRSNLRKTSKEFILGYVKDKPYFELCKELVTGQFQREILPKLKKVYPLSFCEIRVFETKELDNIPYTYSPEQKKKEEVKTLAVESELSPQEQETEEEKEEVKEKTQAEEIEEEEKAKKSKKKSPKKEE